MTFDPEPSRPSNGRANSPAIGDVDEDLRAVLAKPHIDLVGHMDEAMYKRFREGLADVPPDGPLVVAISTQGGEPEIARAMADWLRLLREVKDRRIVFLGRVAVYSAGATFMAGFRRDDRFLTRATRIMVHERSLTKTIHLEGPLRGLPSMLKPELSQIEHSIELEEEGFRAIIEGSKVTFDEIRERAKDNWYIEAEEAKELGLIAGVI